MNNFSQFALSIRQTRPWACILVASYLGDGQPIREQCRDQPAMRSLDICMTKQGLSVGLLVLMAKWCQLWKICNECNYQSGISPASCIPDPLAAA